MTKTTVTRQRSRPAWWAPRRCLMAVAAATLLGAAVLAACGGSDEPAPTAPTADEVTEQRAQALLAKMTLDEKILLVHGSGFPPFFGNNASGRVSAIPRLGIPEIRYRDSASGVTLDGGLNLAREPRNGRTFEYLGEDPVLAGELMVARTEGTQAQRVIATLKHFAGNQQEINRFASNSVIDERTLRELYLLGFEMATLRARPGSVMCAYNLLNNEKSCENRTLLTHTLKGEWGFKGQVQSDWFAGVTDTAAAANAGLDEEQPGSPADCTTEPPGVPCFSYFGGKLKQAVQTDGTVTQARLDDMVLRKLRTLFRLGIMDNPPPQTPGTLNPADADAIALESAERGMVLLKNAGAGVANVPVLPLKAANLSSIVLIGGHADKAVMGGGGSGQAPFRDDNSSPAVTCLTPGAINPVLGGFSLCAPWQRSAPLVALKALLPGVTITYVDGGDTAAAKAAAAAADAAIVFGTQYTMEGLDLPSLALPDNAADPANQAYDQNALITAVASVAKRTVVVLENGSAVKMPWLDQVHGVLAAWYPGVRGGEAIANVLTGKVNPSGKLPLTFPKSEDDLPQKSISATDLNVIYAEGLKMGYRWFDAKGIEPLFSFGHGLSYTRFSYSGLSAKREDNGDVTVSFTLKNTGDVAGAEVAQVYASLPAAAGAPPQRLVAFQRVELAPGASSTVSLKVPASRWAIWDKGWKIIAGTAGIKVGGSSRASDAVNSSVQLNAGTVAHAL
jgi:beta-glucosidase